MGEGFLIVNPAKRQFLDAGRFGENNKRSGILCSRHGSAVALLILNTRQLYSVHPLVGSWVGDPVIAAGYFASPDTAGIQTTSTTHPERNLYGLAWEEFEDISHQAIVMLCQESQGYADEFVTWTKQAPSFIVELGDIVFQLGCPPLQEALERILGPTWAKEYKAACQSYYGRRLYHQRK
ncbi:MAG TPA: hypothetical protein VFD58_28730 [Blastocatellia bacterium]|nr:hypothetical protein [Blastocatellia bacterium]